MTPALEVLPEPKLEFRHGQAVEDPRDGLALFGPYGADAPYHPRSISYALIGHPSGVKSFRDWSTLVAGYLTAGAKDPRLWPTFPGFEAAFSAQLSVEPTRTAELDADELGILSRDGDPHKRAMGVANIYLAAIERVHRRDEPIDVCVCVVPDVVFLNCRPQSRVPNPTGDRPSQMIRAARRAGQVDMFDAVDPDLYRYSIDFRRQLKARVMRLGVPVQIVRESTLRTVDTHKSGQRPLTPLSDRAWNLGVALYYKAGGKPWRLAGARDGVCYIGLAYRREEKASATTAKTACCAAQMFLDSGDGIVFMGEFGPWYSEERNEFHLTKDAARALIKGVLATYEQLDGKPLREIFIHCRSGIQTREFEGFAEACPSGANVVGVRVKRDRSGLKLFREGTRPPLRGSCWTIDERLAFLWTSGFKPRLASYDGAESPVPLRIDVQHGTTNIATIVRDIYALTKLNYNSSRFGDSQPVTVGFSDAVGEILVSNPAATERSPKFKFYI